MSMIAPVRPEEGDCSPQLGSNSTSRGQSFEASNVDTDSLRRLATELRGLGESQEGRQQNVAQLLRSTLGSDTLVYGRVTVVVQRDATVYLASIGNLLEDTYDVGLLKCRSPLMDQAASHGLCVDTFSESGEARGPSVHSKEQAFKQAGASVIISVPISAPPEEATGSSSTLIGFITLGWSGKPDLATQYVPALQLLAREVAPGFTAAMKDVCNDVSLHFLPYLAPHIPPKEAGPSSSGTQGPCRDAEGDQGPGAPPGEATLARTPSPPPDLQTQTSEEEEWYPKKSRALSTALSESFSTISTIPAQSLWLSFKDAGLEDLFKYTRAATGMSGDFWYTVFSLVVMLGIWRDPVLWGQPGAITSTAALLGLLTTMWLFPDYYRHHREVISLAGSFILMLGFGMLWPAYVNSPVATPAGIERVAWREIFVSPAMHATVCLGSKVRFSTAAAIRGPVLLAASLYSAIKVASSVWGWGVLTTSLVFGIPCLFANVSMLALVYTWEKQERITFARNVPVVA
eukprot:jgi/Botrbrau1/8221/Bobra.0392s0017.1